MPYIRKERRPELDKCVDKMRNICAKEKSRSLHKAVASIVNETVPYGDLNYVLYAYCKRYVEPSYNNYKKYIGTLIEIANYSAADVFQEIHCCVLEIYRRIIAPYEDKKMEENGDIE